MAFSPSSKIKREQSELAKQIPLLEGKYIVFNGFVCWVVGENAIQRQRTQGLAKLFIIP